MVAALEQILGQSDIADTFHDPAVHAALEDVRRAGPQRIAAYRDDAAVMAALSKLLEIENILEKL